MRTGSEGTPPLLMIEDDLGLRRFFTDLLTEAGYACAFAWSLEEARRLVDERTFALVLADLFVSHASTTGQRVRAFRALAQPTPLALLTRLPLAGVIDPTNLAFVLPMPFDIEECLGLIAAALKTPLNVEQQRQVETVRRYLAALETLDWERVLALCTEEVIFVPPARSRIFSVPSIQGAAAFRASSEAIARHYPAVHYLDLVFAATPLGVAVRYTNQWQTPEGLKHRASTTLFYFQGELISHVGQRVNLPPFPEVTTTAE